VRRRFGQRLAGDRAAVQIDHVGRRLRRHRQRRFQRGVRQRRIGPNGAGVGLHGVRNPTQRQFGARPGYAQRRIPALGPAQRFGRARMAKQQDRGQQARIAGVRRRRSGFQPVQRDVAIHRLAGGAQHGAHDAGRVRGGPGGLQQIVQLTQTQRSHGRRGTMIGIPKGRQSSRTACLPRADR
jgi:hypothetical protein